MEEVIEDLRASKIRHEEHLAEMGKAAGRQWAMHDAEVIHLERLEKAHNTAGTDWDLAIGVGNCFSAYAAREHVFFIIEPDSDGDRIAATDFWSFALDDEPRLAEEDAFIIGFVEGSLEAYQDVHEEV